MNKAIIILLCSIVLMVIALGSMVKVILEEVSQIYGALVVKGYLKGADDETDRR